jgi:NAD(P)-dependent dehydrogenase (short-subunit alcohol dehydrogenase family)
MEGIKAVLITGASTGIGRKITEHLAAEGHFVYAGARKDSDLHALGIIRNVQALRLDVTNSQDIAAAVDAVKNGGRGLYGLVNNAGVATFGAVVDGNDEEFELVMAVNVHGVYRVTKAFAPLIVAEKGRMVTIGSISGILAGENISAYSMSKHAVEAFTDSLALEMELFGVQVSVIEPGNFSTEILKNVAGRLGADPRLPDCSKYKEPDDVATAVALALFEPRPKRRYLIVPNEDEAQKTIRKQIEQLVQLNEGHPYTYDRNALIRMLDGALEQSHPRSKR